MIKKTIAILSAFATVFAFAACGKLEKNSETTAAGNAPTLPADINATELYIKDSDGSTIPVNSKVNEEGSVYYEYTDVAGNNVTLANPENIIGVTKYSEDEIKELENEIKEWEENPEKFTEPEVDFVLDDKPISDDKLNKNEDVPLDSNGQPVRDKAIDYEELFTKDNFTFVANVNFTMDGNEVRMPLSWYKNGKNMLMELSYPDASGASERVGMLIKDGKCYFTFPSRNAYMELPKEVAEEMFDPEMFEETLSGSSGETAKKYTGTYNVEINGATYSCDIFETSTGGKVKKYYDANGTLVRNEIINGKNVNIIEIVEASDKCDPKNLKLPRWDMSGLANLGGLGGNLFG